MAATSAAEMASPSFMRPRGSAAGRQPRFRRWATTNLATQEPLSSQNVGASAA